jgi:hypothetical protein
MNLTIPPLVSQIASLITTLVGYALLVLIGAAVLGEYGVKASFLPRVSGQSLIWLCGCFWLLRGGKLSRSTSI